MSTRRTLFVTAIAALLVASTFPAGVAPAVATPGDSVATDETTEQTANATVTAAQPAQIGVWTAPKADFAALDDREAVLTAIRDGSLTRDRTVAEGDVVVFAVPASGAFGALDREKDEREPYADAFVALVTDSGFRFHLNQTDPAPNRARAKLDLAATNENDGLNVVPDERNGTLFVAMRSDRMRFDRGQREALRVQPGQEFEANFTIAESVGLSGGRRTALGTVAFVARSATFDTTNGSLQFDLGLRCDAVSGHASVAPGTELSVSLRGTDGAFALTRDVTVARDGTFRTFLTPGTLVDDPADPSTVSFTATADGLPASETDGLLGFRRSLTTVSFTDQAAAGRTVTVDSVTLPEPGFVALYRVDAAPDPDADAADCPVEIDRDRAADTLGVSDRLPATRSTDVRVRLETPPSTPTRLVAVPVLDTNGNGRFDPRTDEPVVTTEGLVAATANVTRAARNETTPPTTDPPTTVTTSPTPHPPDTPEPTTTTPTATTTTADGPGFGPLAALLALVALTGLAAVRRR